MIELHIMSNYSIWFGRRNIEIHTRCAARCQVATCSKTAVLLLFTLFFGACWLIYSRNILIIVWINTENSLLSNWWNNWRSHQTLTYQAHILGFKFLIYTLQWHFLVIGQNFAFYMCWDIWTEFYTNKRCIFYLKEIYTSKWKLGNALV